MEKVSYGPYTKEFRLEAVWLVTPMLAPNPSDEPIPGFVEGAEDGGA
jgi:hypothetical protein